MKFNTTIRTKFIAISVVTTLFPWLILLLICKPSSEGISSNPVQLSTILILACLSLGINAAAAFWVSSYFRQKLNQFTTFVHSLSKGKFSPGLKEVGNDEFRDAAAALENLRTYLRNAVLFASQLSLEALDSCTRVESKTDELGSALDSTFQRVTFQNEQIANLSFYLTESIADFTEISTSVEESTSQIERTIQAVARGTLAQSDNIHQTGEIVKEMSHLVADVTKNMECQASAVQNAQTITDSYAITVQKAADHTAGMAKESAQTKELAQSSSRSVNETVESVQAIQSRVTSLAGKVTEMGQRSDQINDFLETIDEIASETNMLAINAAIEAARSAAHAEKVIDNLLNQHMITEAKLVAQILYSYDQQVENFWTDICQKAALDAVYITNADGVVVYSNQTEGLGWRFPENPAEQAFIFRKLLTMTDGAICQPPSQRSLDQQVYKFVGVPRQDQPGIIQVGFNMRSLTNFSLQIGGFAVVASEVNRLADNAKKATREISALVKSIQITVLEAQKAMKESLLEVENGVVKANHTRAELNSLRTAAESVYLKAEDVSKMVLGMEEASTRLGQALKFASQIISQNNQSIKQVSEGFDSIERAVNQIASIEEQNNSATQAVKSQIDFLTASAARLEATAAELSNVVKEPPANTNRPKQKSFTQSARPFWAN